MIQEMIIHKIKSDTNITVIENYRKYIIENTYLQLLAQLP